MLTHLRRSLLIPALAAALAASCAGPPGNSDHDGDDADGLERVHRALTRSEVDGHFPVPTTWTLAPGFVAATSWKYRTTPPTGSWTSPSYSTSGWLTGSPGFGDGSARPGDRVRTTWPASTSELWLRTTFSVGSSTDLPKIVLWARWDDSMDVYINGTLASTQTAWSGGYRPLALTAAGRAALKVGTNTIAVNVKDTGGGRYFDLGVKTHSQFLAMPLSGSERTAELAKLTAAVRRFMLEKGIGGGTVAVMKKDQVVLARGIGFSDKALTKPIAANAVLRLASNDKLLTLAAITRIIHEKTVDPVTGKVVTWETALFPMLVARGLMPAPGHTIDPAVNRMTLRHLVEHKSGIRELPPVADLYSALQIAPGTSTIADNVRWLYSQPAEYEPGTSGDYRSSGYFLLRYVVQVLKGNFLNYLRNPILAPVGTTDVFVAAERLEARQSREPGYLTFEAPYDRWVYLENYLALSSTAEAYVRYMRGYHLGLGTRLLDANGQWAAVPDNGASVYGGGMEGTSTVTYQRRWDEVSVAILLNTGTSLDPLVDELATIIDGISPAGWGL